LPKQFRCVSVDLIARRAVVHRRGPLVDVVGCSLRLPGVYAPKIYDGTLHVDGGVLNNLPVDALAGSEGPVIAVSIISRASPNGSGVQGARVPRVPGVVDTLMRTMTIGSGAAAAAAMARAHVVIQPDTSSVGLLEFHQIDRAREAGRIAARAALAQIRELQTLPDRHQL
jgi:predicted acylesterase/phospholipase RssA